MSTRKRSDEDFDRELASHLELEAERARSRTAWTPDAARTAARRGFGNVTTARERFYEAGRLVWLDHLVQDVRCAARNMRRAPVASIVAIASLAAGIGATTVTLTVRDAVFHKPPPLYQRSGPALARAGRPPGPPDDAARQPRPRGALPHLARQLRLQHRRDHGAARAPRSAEPPIAPTRPRRAPSRRTSSRSSASGRTSARPSSWPPTGAGSAPRALLSYGLWQRLFDGRSDVIGQVVWIDNRPHTITGVLPERFWFGDMNSPIWTLLDTQALAPDEPLGVIVRRPAGETPAMLEARLRTGLADYARAAARRRARSPGAGARRRGHADRPSGGDRAALHPRRVGRADAAHRLRERRDPDDRAVDGARARDRDSRVDRREPRPDRPRAAHGVGPGGRHRRPPGRVLHVRAARAGRAARRRRQVLRSVDRPARARPGRRHHAPHRLGRRPRARAVRDAAAPDQSAARDGRGRTACASGGAARWSSSRSP